MVLTNGARAEDGNLPLLENVAGHVGERGGGEGRRREKRGEKGRMEGGGEEGNNGGPRRLLVAPMVIWEGRGQFMFLRARDASQVGTGV